MKYTYSCPEMRLFYENMFIEISYCYKVQIYHNPHPSPMSTTFTVYVLGVYFHAYGPEAEDRSS